jgi:site-specific DNA-cytosine methylase
MISTAVLETHGTILENKAVFMVEINQQARSFLKANFVPNSPSPAPCLFGDIMEWVVKKPRGKWTAKNITLSNTARCYVHGKECSTIRGTMDVSGPPCVLFSQSAATESSSGQNALVESRPS